MNLGNKEKFLEQVEDEKVKQDIINRFHALYYYTSHKTWKNTKWMGTSVQKCPLDLWVYQELIYNLRPTTIIETGTGSGGATLFYAMICEAIGHGEVLTVDIELNKNRPYHKRITEITGSSISLKVIDKIKEHITKQKNKTCMVILDSDHKKEHVLEELKLYSQFVTPTQYLIVEDTNINGHPVCNQHGEGPAEAINEFLKYHSGDFIIDKRMEKFNMTFNNNGFLLRAQRCK